MQLRIDSFIVVKHFMLLILLLSSFPLHANETDWQSVSNMTSLHELISKAKPKTKIFVIAFDAGWSTKHAMFKNLRLSVEQSSFPEASFALVDITNDSREIVDISDSLKIVGAPTLIALNRGGVEIPGTRVVGSILDGHQLANWLVKSVVLSANSGPQSTQDDSRKSMAGVSSTVVSDKQRVRFLLTIQPNYYLYARSIVVKLPGTELGQELQMRSEAATLKDDPYFGRVEVYTGKLQIDVMLSDLKGMQCPGHNSVMLKYQTNTLDGILNPTVNAYFNVDC